MFENIRKKLAGIVEDDGEDIVFKDPDEDIKLQDEVRKSEMPEDVQRASIEGSNIELKVMKPESVSEVSTVADHLLKGCSVILNLELLDQKSITRMLDFLRGVTYTINGEIKHVSKATYIITAEGIDISDKY